MRRTVSHLADGREIVYFDDSVDAPARCAVDTRDLNPVSVASQLRLDALTGEWVVLAAHRQERTHKPAAGSCPLCPSRTGNPTEIPDSDYDVVVFENRFASLAANERGEDTRVDGSELVPTVPGHGRCEVVCFTSEHNSSFAELSPRRVRTVMDAWADRTIAVSEMDGVRQVFPFENRGEEIGVTLHHPHGQIYGYPFVTPRTNRMIEVARAYRSEHGRAVLGDVLAVEQRTGTRIVERGEYWTAFVPPAARWPVHLRVVPHRQVADLSELSDVERDEFAELYPRVLRRCDNVYASPLPYVAAWHQAPTHRDRELCWLHLELFSVRRSSEKLKYLAGSESGMAVWINDVTPERIAESLRAAGS